MSQPDLLIQFIGALVDCDPTEGTVTFRMRDMPASAIEAFVRFTDKHIRAGTQILVLTYDLVDFQDYHKRIAVQLQAQQLATSDGKDVSA